MRILPLIAVLANLGAFVAILFMWFTNTPTKGADILIATGITVFPMLNLFALVGQNQQAKPSILGLYFAVRRAKLEKQLAELKN